MMRILLTLLLLTVLCYPQSARAESSIYDYPLTNPYEATLTGMPRELEIALPAAVPTRDVTLTIFPERPIPAVFWYERGLACSLAYQDHAAPLIFLIGGAGARHDEPIMVKLQKLLHHAGFHVLAISSPTHMDFIVNAGTGLPGNAAQDAQDLYRVMTLAYAAVRPKIAVSSVALAGYSLGAFHAAFVAKRDAEEQQFNFTRVLLINPPVSLLDAVSGLDRLLAENIPGGMDNFDGWLRSMLAQLVAPGTGPARPGADMIADLCRRLPRTEANVKAILGLAFRMVAADMIFTADIMNGGGHIIPTHVRLTATTSLTRYAMVAYRTRFMDYFDDVLLPHIQQEEPGLTREAFLDRLSLQSLTPYLRGADHIGLLHNVDDILLAPGDIAYLEGVFGSRARIFPSGGHLGNLFHPVVAAAITDFLTRKGF